MVCMVLFESCLLKQELWCTLDFAEISLAHSI